MVSFEALFQNLPGGTEENQKTTIKIPVRIAGLGTQI
jgi:hypothetical protein